MAEILVAHSPDLTLVGGSPLAAATAAGKDVVVQAKPDGKVRALVFSRGNLARFGAGELVELIFRREGGEGASHVAIDYERPLFAPHAANVGLVKAEPLVIAR